MSLRRCLAAAALALGLMPGVASADEREDPSRLPFYARTVHGDSPWSVAIFYRPVACIPRDFNLERLFDAPRAFTCGPQTVDSFAIWDTGIGIDPAGPHQSKANGLGAVPIWFVPADALADARSDGVLTMPELEALSPLKGVADFFTETLHPRGAVTNPLLVVNASGTLDDGRAFRLHITRLNGIFHLTFED